VQAIITDVVRPNGLAFSPDERRLHVADTGITHDPQCTPKILVYDVSANARRVERAHLCHLQRRPL
jgi:gluconolactonase